MFSFDGTGPTHKTYRASKDGRDLQDALVDRLQAVRASGLPYYVNAVIDPANVEGAQADIEYIERLGVERLQVCYRSVVEWQPAQARRLLAVYEALVRRHAAAPGRAPALMNLLSDCEPALLSDQILADIDGQVYLDLVVLTERTFPKLRSAMRLGSAADGAGISSYGRSQTQIFELYQGVYPPGTPEGRILINNIRLGMDVRRILKRGAAKPSLAARA